MELGKMLLKPEKFFQKKKNTCFLSINTNPSPPLAFKLQHRVCF